MKQHFYHHLIEIDTLHIALDKLELDTDEKQELVQLIDSNIHHAVLDTVLSELSEEDKKTFLTFVAHERHDEIWQLLKLKVGNVEDKIVNRINALKEKMHQDISEAHSKKDDV